MAMAANNGIYPNSSAGRNAAMARLHSVPSISAAALRDWSGEALTAVLGIRGALLCRTYRIGYLGPLAAFQRREKWL